MNVENLKAQAMKVAGDALRSQGGRPNKVALEALVDDLMAGGAPQTYGERFAQMALQLAGLAPRKGGDVTPTDRTE
jgi:hypothetical protein